jgi:penicillin-binding protein 1B
VALKLKEARRKPPAGQSRLTHALIKALLACFVLVSMVGLAVFSFYYIKYERVVDQRLKGRLFNNSARIYAAPPVVRVGEQITAADIARDLRQAGYVAEGHGESGLGTYRVLGEGIEVEPGPDSYHASEGARIHIADGQVQGILSLGRSPQPLSAYALEPQLVTALADNDQRSKRRLLRYDQIPKVMVDAVTAIEDRRFFQHSGVNYFRLAEAVWVDLGEGRRQQGGSTLTMQVARGFFLTPEKTVKRKLTEMLIAVILEQRLTKQQIFELYANQMDMGQRGSFTIRGFGEASRAYFNKDIKDLTVPEAALLAGLLQAPSYLSPYRHPDRALERRNLVLDGMLETGAITQEECEKAKATPLKLAPPNVEASDAPYFVDLVHETLLERFKDQDLSDHAYRIYTTLDPTLQSDAAEAVQYGMKIVDDQVNKLRTRRVKVGNRWETKTMPGPQAQVALVVLDPHTGQVLALVGGRNYGSSQLNHAVAGRPTGSAFKPFVYAAAINTALDGSQTVLTPASIVDDSPTTFTYGDQIYEPRNFGERYLGPVPLTTALKMSLNNATVKVAETVGYDKVAALARAAGIKSVQPTPAMAIGAYDASPLDVAGAYTVFANGGLRLNPIFINSVRDAQGQPVAEFHSDTQQVLDPRVAYIMTTMMAAVINSGTAAGVRGMGFTAPAAGKTGTSHDGWFAGYTSNLLCIVWVGYDDYSDLRLEGAHTAAPIWAEFMKHAIQHPGYKDVHGFSQPAGVVDVQLDKVTNRLATASCPDDYTATFIAGTEPHDTCDNSAVGAIGGFFSKLLGLEPKPSPPPAVSDNSGSQQPPGQAAPKKKGLFGKFVGLFKGDKPAQPSPAPASPSPSPSPAPAGSNPGSDGKPR